MGSTTLITKKRRRKSAQQARKAYERNRDLGFPQEAKRIADDLSRSVRVRVIFADAKQKAKAQDFLKFMLQEENLTPYVEGWLGRWFPVTRQGQESPFWRPTTIARRL